MSISNKDDATRTVLDAEQLKRIESVHRGFLYQHLFASGCLLLAAKEGVLSVSVETDEDIELILPDRHLYLQVKTRAVTLNKSDIESALHRFEEIRNAHLSGARDLKPELWIVSNVHPSPTLFKELEGSAWSADVFFRSLGYGTGEPTALPPACKELTDIFAWCIEAASNLPFRGLRPDTLVLKLAAAVQFACTGAAPKGAHDFRTEELPQLFEQIVVQLHHLPDSPVPYRAQQNEPPFESTSHVRLIVGFSGAGKTCWAAEGGLHAGRRVGYFDIGDTPGPAVVPCLARELAAQLIASDSDEFRRIFLPGSTGLDSLRMLAIVLEKVAPKSIVVLDNAQRIGPEQLQSILLAIPTVDWVLLAQPWPESTIIEAQFKIEAETLRGWSTDTIGEEFAASECYIGPPDCERVRRFTGGLPLYVQDAARLTREYYSRNVEKFLCELESLTNAKTTGQQAILGQVNKRLSDRASNAMAILALSDIALNRDEVVAILTTPLGISPGEVAKVVRELGGWGIIENYRDGRLLMHDAFRVIAKEKQLEMERQVLDSARRSLVEVLSQSPKDVSRTRLFCSLLPLVGKTKTLVEIASGASEYFHEFGLTSEFLRLLSVAADSEDLSPEDRFWAADTVAFWSLEQMDQEECSKRLEQMDVLLPSVQDNSSERTALTLKKMLVSGQEADLKSVHRYYHELMDSQSITPTESRVIRYDYAHALFKCGEMEQAETESSKLIEEYYDALGLKYEDVFLKNPLEIKDKLPDPIDALDDLKHLADSLDLCAHVLNAQGKSSGLRRYHAIKFYALSNAMISLIRVGQDFIDECLGQLGDPSLARDFMETKLLPHIKESKLLNYLVPVHSQYAVVLAYCGEFGLAREVMSSLESYVKAMPQCKEEFDNQRGLIELIAEGKVRLRLREPVPSRTPTTARARIGRNEKCPCGSGLKYKRCHGR